MKLTDMNCGITDIYYDINERLEIQPESDIKIQTEDIIRNHPVYFFDTEEFHAHHHKNAKKVFRLIFMDGSLAAGFCYVGYTTDNKLKAPYSAPFSDIYTIKKLDSVILENIVSCLKRYSDSMDAEIQLTFVPLVYDAEYAVKTGVLLDSGFKMSYAHVSNYLDLQKIGSVESFISEQSHSFRKNIKRAMKSNLKFSYTFDTELYNKDSFDIRAYDVIKRNRQEKGFPLAMSFDQIKQVEDMKSSQVDYFLVSKDETDIAAAIVFKVSEQMVQVVYWGSLEHHSKMRPMEFLAASLIDYYKERGFLFIDIGPSTADDKISHGLLAFKKNIGCETTLKMTFVYKESD